MELKCKLDQIIINMQEKVASTTYLFKPTKEAYEKGVTLKISSANASEIMSNLNLPTQLGDTITLKSEKDKEQTELPGKGENGKKKGRTASTD